MASSPSAPTTDVLSSHAARWRAIGRRVAPTAIGPTVAFVVTNHMSGIAAATAVASAITMLSIWHARRIGATSLAWLGGALATAQAIVTLWSGDPRAYLALHAAFGLLSGTVLLGSVARRRPLLAVLARDAHIVPAPLLESELARQTLRTITLVWGVVYLARSLVKLAVLASFGTGEFLVVHLATGVPVTVALIAWSLRYGGRRFGAPSAVPPSPNKDDRYGSTRTRAPIGAGHETGTSSCAGGFQAARRRTSAVDEYTSWT